VNQKLKVSKLITPYRAWKATNLRPGRPLRLGGLLLLWVWSGSLQEPPETVGTIVVNGSNCSSLHGLLTNWRSRTPRGRNPQIADRRKLFPYPIPGAQCSQGIRHLASDSHVVQSAPSLATIPVRAPHAPFLSHLLLLHPPNGSPRPERVPCRQGLAGRADLTELR